MIGTWNSLGTVPVFGERRILYSTSIDWDIHLKVHQKYIWYIFLNAGGSGRKFITYKTDKERRENFPAFAKLVSELGTKAAPLLDWKQRMCFIDCSL
jgi:hypothetical protein